MEEPRRLGGRYELGSVLGRGGMAEVYLAHDTRLGRTVAVKTLRADLARDPSFQARFRREAQSAASLNHPAIVAVYDTGEDYVDNISIPYIVMEYVDGSTLRELLHSGRKLLPERTLEMTIGILQALEYSHRNGIVHRDIKPANVMLTRTGQVKVMDFGIARAMGDSGMTMTQTSAVIGTAQYLSPEQAKGEQVDARSDLYSTGCLLYELLTVRPPFIGDSPVAVAYQHVREEPQSPSNFDAEITPEMDAIVLKALVKDPDYRYQSADEMRADIEACLDGQPVAATAAMGMPGYGGYDAEQPTTAIRQQDQGDGQTSMMPPVPPDEGGYDDRPDRRRGRPQKKSNTSTILLIVAGVLVLVGAILIGKSLFTNNDSNSGKVAVPQLVGQSLDRAKESVANSKLKLTVAQRKPCDNAAKGDVCSQDPKFGGATLQQGETISVVVSTGAPKIDVPNVNGDTEDEATQLLEGKGFKVNPQQVESNQEEGKVFDQSPKGNTTAQKGSEVTIKIAKSTKIPVPDVKGRTFEDASKQLTDAGFQVSRAADQESEQPVGTVISQDPGGGEAAKGATITLTVAKAKATPSQTAVPEIRGKKLSEAKQILNGAGFTNIQIAGGSNGGDNAIVTGSDPAVGTQEADPGSTTVTLTTMGGGGGGGGGGGHNNGGGNGGDGGIFDGWN